MPRLILELQCNAFELTCDGIGEHLSVFPCIALDNCFPQRIVCPVSGCSRARLQQGIAPCLGFRPIGITEFGKKMLRLLKHSTAQAKFKTDSRSRWIVMTNQLAALVPGCTLTKAILQPFLALSIFMNRERPEQRVIFQTSLGTASIPTGQ